VIGSDGFVSLAALQWLAAQDASFVLLERDGSVLATTGPVRSSDARLRRAQALAHQSGAALRITRELLSQKLAGQERVTRHKLLDTRTADVIGQFRVAVATAETIDAIRHLESQGAASYWAAWRDLPISFPKVDLPRVPEHWRRFDTRKSPLTGSQRLAANPANAVLNYLYAVLESETRLAVAALGLDPGLGFWHVDTPARDSLACDLMEPVRPQVDAFLLDWITREPLKRAWFFEQRDGNCRLMSILAIELAQTAQMWGRAVAPLAEWVTRMLWSSAAKPKNQCSIATPLTQRNRSEARGGSYIPTTRAVPGPEKICRTCGALLKEGKNHCASCSVPISRAILIEAAKRGRIATHSPEAEALRAATQRRQVAARMAWQSCDRPDWLSEQFYSQKIQPRLTGFTNSAIASVLLVSKPYAADIRSGRRRPHPRHWQVLAQLVNVCE